MAARVGAAKPPTLFSEFILGFDTRLGKLDLGGAIRLDVWGRGGLLSVELGFAAEVMDL